MVREAKMIWLTEKRWEAAGQIKTAQMIYVDGLAGMRCVLASNLERMAQRGVREVLGRSNLHVPEKLPQALQQPLRVGRFAAVGES